MQEYKLNPIHIKLFPIDEKTTLFFHSDTLQIYPLEDTILISFLESYKNHGYKATRTKFGKKDFKEIYNFICKQITSAPVSPKFVANTATSDFYSTILPIASKCNLNCPYCFAQTDGGFHFGDYTKEDIDKVAAFIMQNTLDKEHRVTIIFFGGEPLLKFDIMEYTVQHFKEKYPDRNVNFTVTTNGTILNEKIIQFFIEHQFALLVSLDGPDNEFNLRKFKNGKNSIDVVLKNIELLKQHYVSVELRATIVNTNPYVVQTFDFFENLQLPFSIVFAYTSENKSHTLSQYSENVLSSIAQQLNDLLSYYIKKLESYQPVYNRWFTLILGDIFRYRSRVLNPCNAGVGFFTITAEGNIFSCAHHMNEKKYCIGTIEKGIIDKTQYIPTSVDDVEECKDCWIKYLCKGGCFSRKNAAGKTNTTAYRPEECQLEQLIWGLFVQLYYHVLRISPNYFEIKDAEEKKEKEAMSLS